MKKHLFIAASLLALLAVSCSNDDIIENRNNEVVASKTITIQATINNGTDTRLGYTDEDGKAMSVAWSEKESFMMYRGTNGTGTTFTNSAEKPSSFTGETPAGEEGSYYAVYGDNITNSDGTLTLDLSQPQIGDVSAKDGITEMMLATTDVLDKSTTLSFKHLLTVLKLTLTLPEGSAETKVKRVTISGLHNHATYTLNGDSCSYEDKFKLPIETRNDTEGFAVTDNKITAYVAVFPEMISANTITIKAETSTYGLYYYTIKSAKQLKAGKVVPVNVTLTKVEPEYVDLGLPSRTMWATMNMGAVSPEDYGDYYGWGETDTKSWYSYDNYLSMSNFNDCGTDNDPLKDYVSPNQRSIAGTDYDVAHLKWGGSWKMPTYEQIKELRNDTYCTWTWTKKYNGTGVAGYIITGKKEGYEGRSIFLPAAGCRSETQAIYRSQGKYWSAIPYDQLTMVGDNIACNVYELSFTSTNDSYSVFNARYFGQSVRPVYVSTATSTTKDYETMGDSEFYNYIFN